MNRSQFISRPGGCIFQSPLAAFYLLSSISYLLSYNQQQNPDTFPPLHHMQRWECWAWSLASTSKWNLCGQRLIACFLLTWETKQQIWDPGSKYVMSSWGAVLQKQDLLFVFFLFSFCCQPAVMRAITANPLSIRNNNFWLQLSKVVISGSFWNFSQIIICKCACNLRQGSPCKANALLEYFWPR